MKKATINALVDLGALVVFIPSLISGLVLYLVLPEGGGYRGEQERKERRSISG
jgi:hypothetical protein